MRAGRQGERCSVSPVPTSDDPVPTSDDPVPTRYDPLMERLREAARPEQPVPAAATAYAESVRLHAYRVTDAQVEAMRAAGLSEDEIFALTVAGAVSAGLERRDAGLRALQ
jgi:alkylhydroperoxidase family enzyme